MTEPRTQLHFGDCREVLKTLPSDLVDAIVSDPPAGIEFMGKEWDSPEKWAESHASFGFRGTGNGGVVNRQETRNPNCRRCRKHIRGSQGCRCPERPDSDEDLDYRRRATVRKRERFIAFLTEIMAECLRVAKPGAYALVWAIPRTSHWTGTAIEDAGWVIQDRISHLFGQGFPKHKSKLKPACEDWWLAWKPDRYATPLPGLDACRIDYQNNDNKASATPGGRCTAKSGALAGGTQHDRQRSDFDRPEQKGRWPVNVTLSHTERCVCTGSKSVRSNGHYPAARGEGGLGTSGHAGQDNLAERKTAGETAEVWQCSEDCPVRLLDEQSGELTVPGRYVQSTKTTPNLYGKHKPMTGVETPHYGDTGGASRFLYVAKASKRDRDEGNTHPTVKPTELMRWLCRLITPPGGTVLDCFMGSGSTGVAAKAERFEFIGIEREPAYFEIAKRRIEMPRDVAGRPMLSQQKQDDGFFTD